MLHQLFQGYSDIFNYIANASQYFNVQKGDKFYLLCEDLENRVLRFKKELGLKEEAPAVTYYSFEPIMFDEIDISAGAENTLYDIGVDTTAEPTENERFIDTEELIRIIPRPIATEVYISEQRNQRSNRDERRTERERSVSRTSRERGEPRIRRQQNPSPAEPDYNELIFLSNRTGPAIIKPSDELRVIFRHNVGYINAKIKDIANFLADLGLRNTTHVARDIKATTEDIKSYIYHIREKIWRGEKPEGNRSTIKRKVTYSKNINVMNTLIDSMRVR